MDSINWESDDSVVLFNPKIPREQSTRLEVLLLEVGLKKHFWLSTSGSSSISNLSPKWVALSKDAILTSAGAVNRHIFASKKDRWVHALPHFHVGGIGITARAYLAGSNVVHYHSKWDPLKFHKLCCEQNGTLTALVPAQLYDLVRQSLRAPSSMRATVIGGGCLSEELYRSGKLLGWNPLPSYGLSECSSQVATASLESLKEEKFPELEFLSHIDEVSTSPEGCLRLRSSSLLTTYALIDENGFTLKDPKTDGWFETEDLVTIEGRTLQIHGRKTDVVKVGGENVNVEHLNRLLSDLSRDIVGEQVILAVPSKRLGKEIHLAETGSAPEQLNQLIETFNKRVLPFERVKYTHHLDEIPRTALKKVKRESLLQMCLTI